MFSEIGFLNQFDRKDSGLFFWIWFFFRILIHSFFGHGFSGPGFESLIDHTNNTNIQYRPSQRKRIIALFLRCRFYCPNRRNTHPAAGFFVIILDAS